MQRIRIQITCIIPNLLVTGSLTVNRGTEVDCCYARSTELMQSETTVLLSTTYTKSSADSLCQTKLQYMTWEQLGNYALRVFWV